MNRNASSILGFTGTLAIALLGAATMATSARAEGPIGQNDPFTSVRTRSDVRAELLGHRGQLSSFASEWNQQRNQPVQVAGSRTRAEVQAEYIAAREQVHAMYSEGGGAGHFAQSTPRAPRVMIARDATGAAAR